MREIVAKTFKKLVWFDNSIVPTEIEIPDGDWVLETSTEYFREYAEQRPLVLRKLCFEVICPSELNTTDLASYTLDYHPSSSFGRGYSKETKNRRTLLVAPEPFGVIYTRCEGGIQQGSLYLDLARQIHRGELGQSPPLPKTRRIRECHTDGQTWVSLDHLAKALGERPFDLIERYLPFANTGDPCDHRLAVYFLPARIPEFFTPDLLPVFKHRAECEAYQYPYVTAQFARTIRYLYHFGHIPWIEADGGIPF